METNTSTIGKFRYWQKFFVVFLIGLCLLAGAYFSKNAYLWWSAGFVLIFSGWYGVLSLFELFEKLDKDKA